MWYSMECSLFCLLIFILLCMPCSSLKGDNETRHNNCLTWRDDKSAVFLTCRVSNFVSPVSFIHAKDLTRVDCYIHNKEHYCTPKGKNITVNRHDSTITIVLMELKRGRDLDGRWTCRQAESSQATIVSLSKGIIVYSWVQIRGTNVFINGSKYIQIECSSCRKPKDLYAEFIQNNKTVASLWKIKNDDCRYEHILCSSSNICSCSQEGNMFSFSIQSQHVNISTNLSCHMQFHDSLRSGTFSTTASHIYTGKDFTITEFKTDVIKENKQITDSLNHNTSSVDHAGTQMPTLTNSTTNIMPSERAPDTGIEVEEIKPEIVVLTAVVSTIVVLSLVLTVGFFLCRRHPSNDIRKKRESLSKDIEMSQKSESTSLLKSASCSYCALARKKNPANCLCFDCWRFYCSECNDRVHKITDAMQFHKNIDIEVVPESFSLSIFECQKHDATYYQYVCRNDMVLCCWKCLELSHSKCITESITDILTNDVRMFTEKIYLDLQSCADQLAAYWLSLLHGQNMHDAQIANVKETLEPTTMESFKLNSPKEAVTSISDLLENLDILDHEYKTDVKCFLDEITNWRTRLINLNKNLKFLELNAGKNQLATAVFLFNGILSEINTKINISSSLYYRQTVDLEAKNRKIVFRKITLDPLEKLSTTIIGNESNAYKFLVNTPGRVCRKPSSTKVDIDMSSMEEDASTPDCKDGSLYTDSYVNTEYLDQNNSTDFKQIKFVIEPSSDNVGNSLESLPLIEHDNTEENPKRKQFLEILANLNRNSGISILSECSIDF